MPSPPTSVHCGAVASSFNSALNCYKMASTAVIRIKGQDEGGLANPNGSKRARVRVLNELFPGGRPNIAVTRGNLRPGIVGFLPSLMLIDALH
jgi:hypothetical protein